MVKMTDKDAYKTLYLKQLNDLGIEKVQQALTEIADGKPVILLCFEKLRSPEEWCHRTMFAEWYEQQTGQKIVEFDGATKAPVKTLVENPIEKIVKKHTVKRSKKKDSESK